ncbi:MAG: glycosyl hydrolase-related protein, partial [Chloroflexota bacterium]|jgi:mannosylglycerate hydrolase
VQYSLKLPQRLTDDRQARSAETVECPVTIWISLYPGVPRVDIRTTFTNNAQDHRLRVHFPTHLNTKRSYADGHFAVIERPIHLITDAEGWIEHPVTTNPQLAFVDVNDGAFGLMIANRGLPEYDVALTDDGSCIALTLLRCVGWLSRDDLATRQGAAGPILPTPEAQMMGSHHFEYSVIPHTGDWKGVFHRAYWFARPLRARWTNRHTGSLGPRLSFLSLAPTNLVLSAFKLADDGSGDLIIRLYNSAEEPTEAVIRTAFPMAFVELSNLAEERGEELSLEEPYALRFPVGGYRIVTLRVTTAKD